MSPSLERRKDLPVFLLVLAAATAGGWAVFYGFSTALIQETAREEISCQLADYAETVSQRWGAADIEEVKRHLGQENSEPVQRDPLEQATPPCHVVVVSKQWQVLAGHAGMSAGTPLHWSHVAVPLTNSADMRRGFLQGVLAMPDGRHLAIAAPLPRLEGYVVAHRPLDQLAINPSSIGRPLLYACLIAFTWTVGSLGFAAYLLLTRTHQHFSRQWSELQTASLKKTEAVLRMRDAIMFGLAVLTESRDPETGNHLQRIATYASTLAAALSRHPAFRDRISPELVETIGVSSILHDIGKVAVSDNVLLKPGPLTPEERRAMEQHATVGGECLARIEQQLGSANFLRTAREIAFAHHERWDGGGYPSGLAGEQIPLAARIVAVCDVYEALSCARVYKPAWPHAECVAYIRDAAGKHFDPDIVQIFLQIQDQFLSIARRFANMPTRRTPFPSMERVGLRTVSPAETSV